MNKIEKDLMKSGLVHHECSKCGFNGYISKDLAKWHESTIVTFVPLGFTCKYKDNIYTIIEHGPVRTDHTRDHNLIRFSKDGFFKKEMYNSTDLVNLTADIKLLNKKELSFFKEKYDLIIHLNNPKIREIFSSWEYICEL